MTMITLKHIEGALGVKGTKKAKKRRTGGDANDQGHHFEKAFTISAILDEIRRIAEDPASALTHMKAQPLGFVDDLVIVRASGEGEYFELKSGSAQRCTTALKYNIARQQAVIIHNEIIGSIHIVVRKELAGNATLFVRENGIPVTIDGFREEILRDYRKILETAGGDLNDSVLLEVLRVLLDGAWNNLKRDANVDAILSEWRYLALNRVETNTSRKIDPDFFNYLRSVGIELTFERDVTRYNINGLHGLFMFDVGSRRWEDLATELLLSKPDDPMVVHALIREYNHD